MKMRGITLVETVLLVVVCVALAIFLWPVTGGEREASRRTACLSNVKQATIGFAIYQSGWDDHFPARDQWMDQMMPYVKDARIYRCPLLSSAEPAYFGHAYNSWLTPRIAPDIKNPELVPMIFDSINFARNASDPFLSFPTETEPPQTSRRTVGFADGHAKHMSPKWAGWKP